MWERDLIDICKKYNLEACLDEDSTKLLLITPNKLPSLVEDTIKRIIPGNITLTIHIGPKVSTAQAIEEIYRVMKMSGVSKLNKRNLSISITESEWEINLNDNIWKDVKDILNKDGFFTAFEVSIGGEKVLYPLGKELKIEEPKLLKPISAEELMDLSIVLKQDMDVNDFINSI